MEISFTDLKEKEIINVFDGKKLGRIIDVLFDSSTGIVRGIVVPGEKKIFRKSEDIFVPLDRIRKIGGDVILVSLKLDYVGGVTQVANVYDGSGYAERGVPRRKDIVMSYDVEDGKKAVNQYKKQSYFSGVSNPQMRMFVDGRDGENKQSFVRYKRIDNKKYK